MEQEKIDRASCGAERDSEFLLWIYAKLYYVHGISRSMGYMQRLMTLIEKIEQAEQSGVWK